MQPSAGAGLGLPRRVRRALAGTELPFWGISLAAHAVLLVLVVFFSPVREIVFRRQEIEAPPVITRGDELAGAIEQIRDRTVEKLRERVALLDAGQERMARDFAALNAYFQPFAAEQRRTAHGRLVKYVAEAVPRQEQLRDLLTAAAQGDSPAPAVAFAQTCLSRILIAQEEIRRGIRLLQVGGSDLVDRQRDAEDAQFVANQSLRWLEDDLLGVATEERRQAELATEQERQEQLLAPAGEAVISAREGVADADARRRESERHWQEERRLKDPERERAAKAAMESARQDWNDSRRVQAETENAFRRATDALTRTTAQLATSQERLEKYLRQRQEHIQAACAAQNGAYAKQKTVIDTLAALLAESPP